MRRSKLPRDNLSAGQRKALRDLRKMEDVVILPADKGNATVLMDHDVAIPQQAVRDGEL